jgi:hypothetical protein
MSELKVQINLQNHKTMSKFDPCLISTKNRRAREDNRLSHVTKNNILFA